MSFGANQKLFIIMKHQIDSAGIINYSLFGWTFGMIWRCAGAQLDAIKQALNSRSEEAFLNRDRLEKAKLKSGLLGLLLNIYKTEYISLTIITVLYVALSIGNIFCSIQLTQTIDKASKITGSNPHLDDVPPLMVMMVLTDFLSRFTLSHLQCSLLELATE